ncbi:MAG TPA: ABC transporter ATP-binding protein [Candidatus Deferrimicrobium sp.]|nr:ABC transporter ATP-binding protein [Candidatus Deferrimicrobium sp.]
MSTTETKQKSIWRHLGPIIRKYWVRYLCGILILAAVDISQTIIPGITATVIDDLSSFTATAHTLLVALLQISALVAGITVGRYFWRFLIWGSARYLEQEVRDNLFAKYLELSADFHDVHKTGDLMALVTNDLEAVRQSLGDGLLMISDFFIMTTFTLIAMLRFNRALTLLALIPLALIALIVTRAGPLVFKLFKRVQDAFSALTDYVEEAMTGMRIIKVFTREKDAARGLRVKAMDLQRRDIHLIKIWGLAGPLIDFLGAISVLVLLWYGGILATRGTFTIGGLVAFNTYIGMLAWPMTALGQAINLFQRGQASAARINEILDRSSTIQELPDAVSIEGELRGDVDFEHVTFEREGHKILDDVSFHIASGEKIGIIGPIGSGKTTIVSLLTRAYEPSAGKVLVDGVDVRRYRLKDLRRAIGVVTQDVFLFSDSLEENINVTNLPVGEKEIGEATKQSDIYNNISEFKDEFGTIVGERGVTLSGGEKQRVTIARAFLKKPRILVLDDALSAVDADTEKHILDNIAGFTSRPTTIVISNRISALRQMDRVLVLNAGRVAEEGTHSALLRKHDWYWRVFRRQLVEHKVEKE